MTRVAVIGATGYAGAELVRILTEHPEVELTTITSRQYVGVKFSKIYPGMQDRVDLTCQEFSEKLICDNAEIIFVALPHKLPMEIVPGLIKKGKKVIDLSADFRFSDASLYESAYQPHTAKDLLERSVYGLCEIYFERIKNADLIGNPGCYPTSVLLPLVPLLKNSMLDPDHIIADSKSGVSGAGRALVLPSHFCEVNGSFKAYKIAEHRHNPEMDEVLGLEAGKPVHITFVPHLVPMTRGMLTSIYATVAEGVKVDDIKDCLKAFYSGRPFIRIRDDQELPDTLHVKGTNHCDIGLRYDQHSRRLIMISAIDNLVKGAAGQAVQNMNIMLGFDETAGLMKIPFPV